MDGTENHDLPVTHVTATETETHVTGTGTETVLPVVLLEAGTTRRLNGPKDVPRVPETSTHVIEIFPHVTATFFLHVTENENEISSPASFLHETATTLLLETGIDDRLPETEIILLENHVTETILHVTILLHVTVTVTVTTLLEADLFLRPENGFINARSLTCTRTQIMTGMMTTEEGGPCRERRHVTCTCRREGVTGSLESFPRVLPLLLEIERVTGATATSLVTRNHVTRRTTG